MIWQAVHAGFAYFQCEGLQHIPCQLPDLLIARARGQVPAVLRVVAAAGGRDRNCRWTAGSVS